MGNSHSQHPQGLSPQWTHSYPRPRHIQPQVKVLPERIPPLRLRTTDNGAILQNGGTLSARKQVNFVFGAFSPQKAGNNQDSVDFL